MPDLTITRVFDAPRDLVFKAWTDTDPGNDWSAPRRFTLAAFEADLRPGGAWRLRMRSPDGEELRVGGTYREIIRPERIVSTHAWQNPDGTSGHETLVTVELAARGNRTEMTFRRTGFESDADRDGHHDGWSECFDRLEEHLAGVDSTRPRSTYR
jgi:uncharacterized protein YndB with AHSA1/START domain